MNSADEGEWVHFHDSARRHPFFGEVQYRLVSGGKKEVKVIIKPSDAVGFELACAALAIDGSKSMMQEFAAHLPPILRKNKNRIHPTLSALALFLANNAQGRVATAYWACGSEGGEIEPIGILSEMDLEKHVFSGPANWGSGTKITPVVSYFWENIFSEVNGQSFALIVTDGAWSDEDQQQLIALTDHMCEEIAAGRRYPVKYVVLALRTDTNKGDLENIQARFSSLDDYEHPSGIDIWDHKWLNELGECTDLFVEMVQDNYLGIEGRILVDGVECYATDNLKFGFQFAIPASATGFTLQIPELEEIYQSLE